jgi:hypothetical protein
MYCPFDILHFLPLFLILASITLPSLKKLSIASSLSIFGISILGLIGGNHVHVEHMVAYSIIDPCYGYFISLAISGYNLVKSALTRQSIAK